MTTIKNFFALLLLVAFVTVFNTNSAVAQAGNPKAEFVLKANEVDSSITMLLPAIQKVREAAARSLVVELQKTQTLVAKINRAGNNMTNSQYEGFQRELGQLEKAIEKIGVSSNSTAGGPAAGSVGACHKSCHDAFGNGFGGGKGWNRFWCKMGCIKVNLPGGGGIGG
jgi:hypothetical protein